MAYPFSYGGATIWAPGVLVQTTIGASQVLSLLPFGTLCFVGSSDGGNGNGSVYRFNDMGTAQRVLRSGSLFNALNQAAQIGGSTSFVACVIGTKTNSNLTISAGTGTATTGVTVGGTWSSGTTLSITFNPPSALTGVTGAITVTYVTEAADAGVAGSASGLASAILQSAVCTGPYAWLGTPTVTSGFVALPAISAGSWANALTATVSYSGGTTTLSPTGNAAVTWAGGLGGGAILLASGDQGSWTTGIAMNLVAGTTTGVAATFFYPDPTSGQTVSVGGLGTAFDNLVDANGLAAAVIANGLLTPASGTNLLPIVVPTVLGNFSLSAMSKTFFSGGTGNGSYAPVFADVQKGINNLVDISFDIGHLVGVYDSPSQVYADTQAQTLEPRALLRRWIHQVRTSATVNQTKVQNSAALVSAGTTAAQNLDSKRSSVVVQQVKAVNLQTGQYALVDAAPLICGMAALLGAIGDWGPATPLTFQQVPTAIDIDYQVLTTTGDRDTAIRNGVLLLERTKPAQPGAVRVVQSVTTAPNGSNGAPWDFGEFSVVRVGDALLANVKAAVETSTPAVIGGGNTLKTMQTVIADVQDVLELALDNQWITGYDPNAIQIVTSGQGSDSDICTYNVSPTRPLNKLGFGQTFLPFTAVVNLPSGTSS